MKKKIYIVALLMSLVFYKTDAVFAENMNGSSEENYLIEENNENNENNIDIVEEEGKLFGGTEDESISDEQDDLNDGNDDLIDDLEIKVDDIIEDDNSIEEVIDPYTDGEYETEEDNLKSNESEIAASTDDNNIAAFSNTESSYKNISVNTFYSDTLAGNLSEKWYKATVTQSGYISLTFNHDYIETGEYRWSVYLYDSEKSPLVDYSYTGKETTSQGGNIGVPAGTYYIKVVSYYSYKIPVETYKIKLNYKASNAWETEFNETYLTADVIAPNTVVYGSLRNSYDNDWYKVTIPKKSYISLSFNHAYLETGENRWSAYIYDSNQNELDYYSYVGKETSFKGENIGVSPGTYYIRIKSYYSYTHSSVDYNFKLNYTVSNAWEAEFNETYSTANMIDPNTIVYGSLRSSYDNDWYKVTVPKKGYISLSFNHAYLETGENRWSAYIYDSNQNELDYYSYVGKETSFKGGNIGVSAGTYYVKIKSYYSYTHSGVDYNFKLNYTASNAWETEFNETYSTANMINQNSIVYGNLRSSYDNDWYKIKLTGGKTSLEFAHQYIETRENRWTIYVYDSNMNEIKRFDYQGNMTHVNSDLGNLSAGIYYIKVCSYYSYTHSGVDYTMKIVPHIHNYKNVVTKATLSRNGKIIKRCSCGAVNGTGTTIYYPKSISLSATTYTYDGKIKKPMVTVKGSNGGVISPSNYTVVYSSGRKNVGTYRVIVKFKGNYSGNVTKTFKIIPKTTSISQIIAESKGFTVKWKKQTDQVTGYKVQYSLNKNFSSNYVTRTVTKNSIISTQFKNLKAKKKYYVRVRTYKKVGGTEYYSNWSAVKTVTTKK